MAGVCLCYSRTCRPVWSVLIFLAAAPFMLDCLQSPAPVVGKMYPRGNHWAVGHLMGKKSSESLPDVQESDPDSDYLTPPKTAGVSELDQYQQLMQKRNQKQMKPQSANRLPRMGRSWREENRDKYLREMSDLLLLAVQLQDRDSN
ncbi:Gastrin-releasing peptide [Channa argus]|uniref:Gastrin-releasing peptide n=1 Tax=Channa argus TaxID=215402 RepID=A0A6G1QHB2_CHAAH|nr:Gastrin-releasing peptide [Channa argus]KAK2888190.1 hypothetical protein Q8A73_019638 [Channa argus]